jgi:hypothetical protein
MCVVVRCEVVRDRGRRHAVSWRFGLLTFVD